MRDAVLSVFYRFVDAFLAIGSANRAYYRALGVPDRRIFDAPYAVDNARFISGATLATDERAEIRRHYGLPIDQPVVLYASKFIRLKASGNRRPRDVHALGCWAREHAVHGGQR